MKGEVIQLASREQIDLDLELTSYVSGSMTSQEKLAFEARLVNDKQLQQKLADEIEFKNQLISGRSESPEFNLEFKDLDERISSKPTRQFSIIAASLFVVLAAGYFLVPNQAPNTPINEFETLTSNDSGTAQAKISYSLIFDATISKEEKQQLLKELQLEQVAESELQGLQQKRLIVRSKQHLSKAEVELIRDHQKVVFFEANNASEQ